MAYFAGSAAEPTLRDGLVNDNSSIRRASLVGLLKLKKHDEIDRKLASQDCDAKPPWIDPAGVVTLDPVSQGAKALDVSTEDVRTRYASLATAFGLRLAW